MDPTVRERLGNLYIGWFYDVRCPSGVMNFNRDNPDPPEFARPRRVSDIADGDLRDWFGQIDRGGPESSKFSRIHDAVARLSGCDCVVLVLPAWRTAGDPLLIDATHRACAVYLLNPRHVELDLLFFDHPNPDAPEIQAVAWAVGAQTGAQET